MKKNLEKICLGVIFLGAALTLLTPLLVDNNFFFPFIAPKVFWFRIIVEVMFLAYLLLVFLKPDYRPKVNVLLVTISAFILTAFLASYLGQDFYNSFWGNMERGEGLILWLHLLTYFLILISVFKEETIWLYFFDFSLIVSLLLSLFALGQVLQLKSILITTGLRVEATIGNPSFLAVYLIFHLAFAAYLFFRRHNLFLRIYYGALFFLFLFIIFRTQTRGAALGALAGIFIASLLTFFFYPPSSPEGQKQKDTRGVSPGRLHFKSRKTRIVSVVIILFLIFSGSFFYFSRQSGWVKNSPTLNRLVRISLKTRTAETRLATWQAAWQGWQDRFWLGYGLENFNVVFDKNFPPIIYQDEGSQVWFDRAHNLVLDRGVTTGIIGLVIYLFFILYPVYYLGKNYLFKSENNKALAIIFISLIAAFLIQDFFVFETITTYIILFFSWAFLASLLHVRQLNLPFWGNKFWLGLFIIYLIFFWPIVNLINIKPARANLILLKALNLDPQSVSFFEVVDQFKKALESKTYGVAEYRIQFIEFIDSQFANLGELLPNVKPVLDYADKQVEKQINDKSRDAKSYLLAMRHYNYTFAADSQTKFERLEKALSFFPELQKLSPTRPHIYQEAGYSNLYLYRNYKEEKKLELAKTAAAEAEKYFWQAVDLNQRVVESYVNLIMLYLNQERTEEIKNIISLMEERGVNFRAENHLDKLMNLAINNKNYYWSAYFIEEVIKNQPQNINLWIKLALAYAYLGEEKKAKEIANQIIEIDSSYVSDVEQFLKELKEGKYRQR